MPNSFLQQASDALGVLGSKVRTDSTVRGVVVVGTVVIGSILLRWLVTPGDSVSHIKNEDQSAFALQSLQVDTPTGGRKTVRRVTPNDIESASNILSNLHVDPMMVACAREDTDSSSRQNAMRWVQRVLLAAAVPLGSGAICLQTQSGDAVSVWWPKGGDVDKAALFLNGAWQFSFRYTGWERRGRLDLWSQAVQPRRRRIMANHDGAYYYLMLAAASPAASAGSLVAVILPVVQRADLQGVPCYYECTDPAVAPVFLSLGFREVEDFTFFGVPVRILKREAQK